MNEDADCHRGGAETITHSLLRHMEERALSCQGSYSGEDFLLSGRPSTGHQPTLDPRHMALTRAFDAALPDWTREFQGRNQGQIDWKELFLQEQERERQREREKGNSLVEESFRHMKMASAQEEAAWAQQFKRQEALQQQQSCQVSPTLTDLDYWAMEATWAALVEQPQASAMEQSWMRATASAQLSPSSFSDRHRHWMANYLFEIENAYLHHPAPYEEGLRLKEAGNLTEAALAFEAALQQQQQQATADAQTEATQAQAIHAWLYLAEIQAENEKEAAAIAAYQHCLKLSPQHAKALMGLAISYTNEGAEAQVLDLLGTWLSSQYPAMDGSSSFWSVAMDKKREALIAAYLQVIQATCYHPSSDPELQVGLGILFYNAGQYDKAIDCFHTALERRPEDYLLWNRLGATLANSHRSEEAIANYERALALKPTFVRARHNLGVSCMNIGCYEEAAMHLLNALSGSHSARAMNISTNLWETLRRDFVYMNRPDLARLCDERNLMRILQEMKQKD